MSALTPYDFLFLRLLELSPFEQRARRWRFGAKTISDPIVARLIASGRAVRDGDHLRLASPRVRR